MDKAEAARRKMQSARDKKMSNTNKIRGSNNKQKNSNRNSSYSAPIIQYKSVQPKFETINMKDGKLLVRGTDYLGVANGTAVTDYSLLFNYMISPLSGAFGGSRLANFAFNYEKYIFKKITFHIQSATPTTTGGSYVAAFDRDVSDPLPALTEVGVQALMGNLSAVNASISESKDLHVSLADNQDFFYTNYTGSEPRLAYQGRIVAMNTTPITSNFSLCIWVSYEVLFMDPALENQDFTLSALIPSHTLNSGMIEYPLGLATTQVSGVPLEKVVSNPIVS